MRVSSDLIQTIFHTGDQRMLSNFQAMQLQEPVKMAKESNPDEEWGIQALEATVKPKDTDMDLYDFVLSLKDPQYD